MLTNKQLQAIAHMISGKIVCWAGSIRSGKTYGTSAGLLMHMMSRDDGLYILSGKTYRNIERNILPYIQEWCETFDIDYRYYPSKQFAIVDGRHKLYLFGGNNEASQDKVQGLTADGVFCDEGALMPQSFVMQCIARCSRPDPFIVITLNKTSPNHWIKSELIDEGKVFLIESTLMDNPHITDDTKAMYDSMFGGHYHQRMIENLWVAATGQIFPTPIAGIGDWLTAKEVIVSVDWATSSTTAGLFFARTDVNSWVIVAEYYHTGDRSPEAHADALLAMAGDRSPVYIVDPSAAPLKLALRSKGKRVVSGNNTVYKGINTTIAALQSSRITVQYAPKLLKEIGGYVWDEKAAIRGEDKPVKEKDHACDALRYFAMRHTPQGSMTPFKKPKGL